MSFRKEFIFYSTEKINISSYKPKNKKVLSLANIKVNILEFESTPNQNFTPTKITFNPSSILGKVVKCDLLGINNEVIIKTNQIITQKIIDDASKHNRLNQLYYSTI